MQSRALGGAADPELPSIKHVELVDASVIFQEGSDGWQAVGSNRKVQRCKSGGRLNINIPEREIALVTLTSQCLSCTCIKTETKIWTYLLVGLSRSSGRMYSSSAWTQVAYPFMHA
jgi:hypothetical protein